MKHTIVAIVSSNPSVLGRIGNLLSRANLDVDGLTMQKLGTKGMSDISMLIDTEDLRQIDHVVEQMDKFVDVMSVADMT
jgi:Acetolactate synthase, small (regulatory) subunit